MVVKKAKRHPQKVVIYKPSVDRFSLGRKKKGVILPVASPTERMPRNYAVFLSDLKKRIQQERLRVVLASNSALVTMYWDIGRGILKKQQEEGWGAKVIDRLSLDLRKVFPDMKGFSPRNLKYMRAFAQAWHDKAIVQQLAAQIPWFHNCLIIDRIAETKVREWYIRRAKEFGWSRNILEIQIENRAHLRQGKAITNFPSALPPVDSDMAQQVFKDPYVFDFLGTADLRREAELEQGLMDHLQKFLLELGSGFAFVGRQVHLELGGSDYYLDLLFYHLKLRCYVVVELKAIEFDPGHVGKLNMYLAVVDDILRYPDDKPTIGLLLVRKKNKLVAEYALGGYKSPMGVAERETQITRSLPDQLKTSLPTIEELEAELSKDIKSKKVK